jgi:DNA mismatch repair protein MutL
MSRIRQLPANVVAKIAAGEVVERPASVVKELVENSIDAGASRIDIELEQGGTELIRVVDDGCGIAPEEMGMAFAPHATSKLNDAEDLLALITMGFRGEALASIAGVAKVQLQSRRPGDATGNEVRCEASVLGETRPWNGTPGTRLEVRQLFYNIPVRKTFLKSAATELGHISEVLTRLALANPTIHVTLKHNGRHVFEIPGSAGLKDRIGLFFGSEVEDQLFEIDSGVGEARLRGYVADPHCNRGNAKLQYLFVNGRWFRDRSLGHALQEAYRGLVMTGRYAVGFLYLDVPPDSVDINVHPQKHEVRFRNQSSLYSLVRSTVKARLLKENFVPKFQFQSEETEPTFTPLPGRVMPELPPASFPTPMRKDTGPSLFSPRRADVLSSVAPWERNVVATPEAMPLEVKEVPEPSLPFPIPNVPVGTALQLHDSYIVLETADGMQVIDQHALHERILYEQLRQRIVSGKLEVQRLLIPEAIDLPAVQVAVVLESAEELAQLGLEVSDFGGNTILLSSYPTLLERRAPVNILKGVIDELMNKERLPNKAALLDHLLATMACKAAVKAGDKLTPEEIAHLLKLRDLAENSHHCPHGRPTSLNFSRAQLDKQFGRI